MPLRTFTDRSPYGIRTPAVTPPVIANKPNWMQSILQRWFMLSRPNKAEATMLEHEDEATTILWHKGEDSYSVKLRAAHSAGTQSQNIFPLTEASTDTTFAWPSGGTSFGPPRNQRLRRDFLRGGPPLTQKPAYFPGAQATGQLHSATDMASDDRFPISGGRPQYSLDFQKPPWRVPLTRKSGLSLMAGPSQFGHQQQFAGVIGGGGARTQRSFALLMAPPSWSDATRGTRGVSGILQRVQGPGTARIPAAFTPSEVH
jgi:hypothetical protein